MAQQDRLLNLHLAANVDEELFARKHTELRGRLASIILQLDTVDRSHDEMSDLAVKAFELSQTLREQWLTADCATNPRNRPIELHSPRRNSLPHNKKALRRTRRRARFESKWRRRESNAEGDFSNDQDANDLASLPQTASTSGPRIDVSDCHATAQASDTQGFQLDWIASAWPQLQPHVRDAIVTLIDGALHAQMREEAANDER